jgi:mRNA-degrading endonuclease RelE of RelBE toxin-antitoxin system
MYDIAYTDDAIEDLKYFKKHEQNEIIDGIEQQLRYEPTVQTRNRKQMRPNEKADWELRIGNFRVLYDVDTEVRIVEIQRIGEKQENTFLFRGREEEL